MKTGTREQWDPSHAEYHAETEHVSHSMLKQFRASRRDYFALFEAKTKAKREPSEEMNLGTALHCALLEPLELHKRIAFAPECDRRTKDGKTLWNDFQAESCGKVVLPWVYRESLDQMLRAISCNEFAAPLLANASLREHSLRCEHTRTRQPIKARLDAVLTDIPLVIDVKTARDVTPQCFSRAMYALGYYTQAAWYADVYAEVYGREAQFAFIAVSNCDPFSCAVYHVHPEDMELGRRRNDRDMDALAACREYDDWREPWEKQITDIRLPKWAEFQETDWSVE